ncbi:Swarming motility regulation protein RssB [Rubripirellula tenax]|uniref:Swarming motility regulation protein RssB n=1 Tax=Rubripirellula tenax TaxID=2528015 RepID=A0A5C6EIP3_9BACT|nr:response regulator transcription factor [Rubripirellula tenax]TWU47511.1 Swarming motility regulation protein RssB [Rubripirellula tenax]
MSIGVLLVEDDVHDVDAVKRAFAKFPPTTFELTHVTRFSDAIQAQKEGRFHVILLDLGLPDSVGLKGLEKLMARASDTPVIVLTGHDDDEMALRGIELGAQEFLCKNDLQPQRLVRAVRHAIKRKQCQIGKTASESDEALQERLAEMAEGVRELNFGVSEKIIELQKTELSQIQRDLVSDIDAKTKASLNMVNNAVPAADFIPFEPEP